MASLAILAAALGNRAKLAAQIGVAESTLWRWETGVHVPPLTAKQAMNALAVQMEIPKPYKLEGDTDAPAKPKSNPRTRVGSESGSARRSKRARLPK